jgi:tetratricopeptide (TPR) repeat protein
MHKGKIFYFQSLIFIFCFLFAFSSIKAQQTATDFFKISQKSFEYKDYDNVIFFCNKALELNPRYGAAYWNRAIAYDCKAEYRKSTADYGQAIRLYDNSTDLAVLYKNRGMVYNTLKMYDSAIADFNKSLDFNPLSGYTWWNRALAFEGLNKPDSAVTNYSKAISLVQDNGDLSALYLLRGENYRVMGKKENAETDFHKVLEMNKEPGYFGAYALFLLGDNKAANENVLKSLSNASSKPKEIKNAYFNASAIYSVMHNSDDSLKYMELALKNGYNDFQYISKDRDFDNVRTNPRFIELQKKYNQK